MSREATEVERARRVPVPETVPVTVRVDHLRAGSREWDQMVVTESSGRDGIVVVVERGGAIGFVRQWRHATGAWTWELPRGFGESGDPLDDAAREVREELGCELSGARLLGRVAPNSGLLAGRVAVVVGAYAGPAYGVDDDGEVAEVEWVAADELDAWLAGQEELDGITLAALYLWRRS